MNPIHQDIFTKSPISIWKVSFAFLVTASLVKTTSTLTVEDYKAFGINDRALRAITTARCLHWLKPFFGRRKRKRWGHGGYWGHGGGGGGGEHWGYGGYGGYIQSLTVAPTLTQVKVPPPKPFVETPDRVVEMASFSQERIEIIMKCIVLLERQGGNIARYIPGADLAKPVISTIMMALEIARSVLELINRSSDKTLTAANEEIKTMEKVTLVILTKSPESACMIVKTMEIFKGDNCAHCQSSIPDFIDKGGAHESSKLILEKLLSTGPKVMQEYLEVLKRTAMFCLRYLDNVLKCCLNDSDKASCRNTNKETIVTNTLASLLQLGNNVLNFVKAMGENANSNVKNLLGRVSTTHAAYQNCLTSGSPEASRSGKPLLEDLGEFFKKTRSDLLSTVENIKDRALHYQEMKQRRLRAIKKQ